MIKIEELRQLYAEGEVARMRAISETSEKFLLRIEKLMIMAAKEGDKQCTLEWCEPDILRFNKSEIMLSVGEIVKETARRITAEGYKVSYGSDLRDVSPYESLYFWSMTIKW